MKKRGCHRLGSTIEQPNLSVGSLVAVILLSAVCQCADLGLDGWAHRMPILFEGYERSTTLVNFPAFVVLHEGVSGFSYGEFASPSGSDLRFTNADRTRFLNHEIEVWDTRGKSYVWVQVPKLSRNTGIWAYWGNAAAAQPPAYTTDGSTWSEGYEAVWHLSDQRPKTESPHGYRDSSANTNDGRGHVSATVRAGQVGAGLALDGADDCISCGNDLSLNPRDAITIELWLRHVGGAYRGVINKGYWTSGPWEIRFGREGSPRGTRLGARVNTDQGSLNLNLYPSPNEWHHVALVYDGVTVAFYLDGRREASGSLSGKLRLVGKPVTIGQNGLNREYYGGAIDEVRISSTARSPDWIRASWRSQWRPAEFASYNAVITNGGGATGVTTVSAHLHGHLYVTDGLPTEVSVFWGEEDGGSSTSGWDNRTFLEERTKPGPLEVVVNLAPDRSYCYRYHVSNSGRESRASRTSTFVTPSVAGTSTKGITWVTTYEGDTLPQPPTWVSQGGAQAESSGGILHIVDSSSDDLCCYRTTWDGARANALVVDARVRVTPPAGNRRDAEGRQAALRASPWAAGAPVGLVISNGQRQGGLAFHPGHIHLFPDRFCPMDMTDRFHTVRVKASGRDLTVYVDGRLKIRGCDAFSKPALESRSFVQFGAISKSGIAEAHWDFVRVGVRDAGPVVKEEKIRIAFSEPWQVADSGRFTQPNLCDAGAGILMLSVEARTDAARGGCSLLMSTDQGRNWVPVPEMQSKTFAPQSVVRLDSKSILGACRRTVHCLNSHSGRCVALGSASFVFDGSGASSRMLESRITIGSGLTRRVAFGRDLIKRDHGSVLATASNETDGCFLLRTTDRGRTWHVFSRIAARGEPSVAFLSDTEATALLAYGPNAPFRQLWSCDGGKTWDEGALQEEGCTIGNLVCMSNGVLACSYGDPGCSVMFSTDGGRTWGHHHVVAERGGSGYATIREVRPGRLLYVYDAPPLTALYIDLERHE